jgi:hypothetical protein
MNRRGRIAVALGVGLAGGLATGCHRDAPDVAPPLVEIILTDTMISGHRLPAALGVRAAALIGMSGVVRSEAWLGRNGVERVCGHLTIVEANLTVDACDWTGSADGDVPDGQADRIQITRKDPGTGEVEVLAAIDNPTDAARYPSRVKVGDWVIRLARQACSLQSDLQP